MKNRIIDDSQLEDVNGGVVQRNSEGLWEVTDDYGNVKHTNQSYDEVVKFAQENGISIERVSFRRY